MPALLAIKKYIQGLFICQYIYTCRPTPPAPRFCGFSSKHKQPLPVALKTSIDGLYLVLIP